MVIGTTLVSMYVKCWQVQQTFEVFKCLKKNALAWRTTISWFALHGLRWEVFDCFLKIGRVGVKTSHVIFVRLLLAFANSSLVKKGRWCFV